MYNIIMSNGALYVSDVKSSNYKSFKNKMKNIFDKNCYITKIDRDQLSHENENIRDWCEIQLNWADVIKIEREQQEEIKNQLRLLDKVEEEIFSDNIIPNNNEKGDVKYG